VVRPCTTHSHADILRADSALAACRLRFFAQDQNSMEILGALAAADDAFDKAIAAHKESMADESYDKAATPASRKKASRESKAQFQAAIEAYSQAIEFGAPEQDEVLGCRAECYASTGQMQKALEDATAAVELNDESDSWLILQGQIYYAMGKSKEAKNSFLEARDINKEIQPQDDGVLKQKETIDAMLEMIADHPWEPPNAD
jgi:tetratricopeptide (TPR) repeat protein